ncbi:MAG: nicotinate (nicotinamide) nucleotide adenylyltransferase [Anaerolineales bacterium]|nr:nicotinate (nicotinamide) nucleotide adenylyltransferase [Anaerolineales bacterium]
MPTLRIGLFGGTFDPPHLGHLILASEASYQFNLSKLLWVLTPNPPHKQNQQITALEQRLTMLELAVANNPDFELSRVEIERPGPHYTVDTVNLIAQQEPQAEIFLLIGGDSLHDLPTWKNNRELIHKVHQIGVMHRPGDKFNPASLFAQLPGLKEKLVFIETLLHTLSSREIRRRAKEGQPYQYYVLPAVYDYIEKRHLYQNS